HPPTSTLFPYTTLFRSGFGRWLGKVLAIWYTYQKSKCYPSAWRFLFHDTASSKPVASIQVHCSTNLYQGEGTPYWFRGLCSKWRSEEHTSELQSRSDLV